MALFRNTIGIPYRQQQRIAEDCLGEENTPNFSAIWTRESTKLNLEEGNCKTWFSDGKTKTEIVFLAGDSTGQTNKQGCDWMGAKWNIRRGLIKMHIIVDSKTKKIYAVSITDEKSGDAPEFKKLLDEALQNIKDSPNVEQSEELLVGCDGAYDSNDNFEECSKQNAISIIPVRKNFSIKTDGSITRKQQGVLQLGNCKMNPKNLKIFDQLPEEQKVENQKQWKINSGYGRRWSAEIAFSTWKRILGENISARVWCNVVREIKFKVMMYHLMIDDAIQQEMNQD